MEAAQTEPPTTAYGSCNIQRHLQSMFYLLRPEETLKMAVKLESVHPMRTRYLVVVSRMGTRGEESCLLGIDCNERTTVGLVLRVLANTQITLDGDGGFSVTVCDRHHIFKPVSVQAMWSALQTLHKVSGKARDQNYFQGGGTHGWVDYYEQRIHSDRSCLNEWHAMDNLESKRPPSPDSIRTKPTERKETEKVIRTTLKEIMMTVDLDEVTSKVIRSRLEEELDMDLDEYKSFIDQEMLVILGQMDAPTEIFDHVYLGSEWNASNYEELRRNGVGHILNVTREIDNFFPGTFDYLNVRVYDDERTDLLKHWDDTFKYITKAKAKGSKVLVHCKMGVSRSASVVIAYAMKAYNWDFNTALKHVKEKRSCIKPNHSFLLQLETYQGILDAMKNKEKLQRSKSETNLKSPNDTSSGTEVGAGKHEKTATSTSEPSTSTAQLMFKSYTELERRTGQELRRAGTRPKSWSPENPKSSGASSAAAKSSPAFMSLEDLSQNSGGASCAASRVGVSGGVNQATARHVLMPFDNGESYSVSPNQIVHLPGHDGGGGTPPPPGDKKVCVLNLATQFEKGESSCFTSSSNKDKEPWDPGEHTENHSTRTSTVASDVCNSKTVINSENIWTSTVRTETTSVVVHSNNSGSDDGVAKVPVRIEDPFSNQLDRVFDREEKRQLQTEEERPPRECPSRQSSWSSYDSAVVCELSRHSSWGSGDTRTLPSRNSSWGSYDMRPREKGMVKRSKQKIEEYSARKASGSDSLTSSCVSLVKTPSSETLLFEFTPEQSETNRTEPIAVSAKISIPQDDDSTKPNLEIYSRLSISAPEPSSMEFVSQEGSLSLSASNVSPSVISTTQCSSVKQHRSFLENMHNSSPADSHNIKKVEELLDSSGKVQNLKKEFEAKSSTNSEASEEVKKSGKSLPSSPVSVHQAKEENKEDFKSLIGMFENNHQVNKRPHRTSRATNQQQHGNTARYSCIEVSQRFYPEKSDKRPPIAPVVRTASPANLVATVITAAAKKKQQQYGKSHPLAKLNVRPRHNNPVYNTM
nr:unnamed protein product [Callosobruchus chinensis]